MFLCVVRITDVMKVEDKVLTVCAELVEVPVSLVKIAEQFLPIFPPPEFVGIVDRMPRLVPQHHEQRPFGVGNRVALSNAAKRVVREVERDLHRSGTVNATPWL